MDKNEATKQDQAFNDLIKTLKHLDENRDCIFQDDETFKGFLIESVFEGKLKATYAIYLFLHKHGVERI